MKLLSKTYSRNSPTLGMYSTISNDKLDLELTNCKRTWDRYISDLDCEKNSALKGSPTLVTILLSMSHYFLKNLLFKCMQEKININIINMKFINQKHYSYSPGNVKIHIQGNTRQAQCPPSVGLCWIKCTYLSNLVNDTGFNVLASYNGSSDLACYILAQVTQRVTIGLKQLASYIDQLLGELFLA